MTVTVTMERDPSAAPPSARRQHEMWLALTSQGLTVLSLDARLGARIQVQAPDEVTALDLVCDAYREALAR